MVHRNFVYIFEKSYWKSVLICGILFNVCKKIESSNFGITSKLKFAIIITNLRRHIVNQETNDTIIKELIRAYWLELEATINYLAISVDLDGIRAEEIKTSLAADIQTEISHAQELAARIKEIDGRVPGSFAFKPEQTSLQPPEDSTDLISTIHGVIEAENVAIDQYNKIIRLCDGIDYVTQDLCIKLLADEEKHRREFRGFLKEFEND